MKSQITVFFHILALCALDPREQLAHEIQTVTNFAQQKQSNSFEMDKLCQFTRSVPKKLPEKKWTYCHNILQIITIITCSYISIYFLSST